MHRIAVDLLFERSTLDLFECNQSLLPTAIVTISQYLFHNFCAVLLKSNIQFVKMNRQVIFFAAILFTLHVTHSKQMQNIDAITQAYLTAEKYLWQLIYSTDQYNRLETFAYIYDTHEEHLGKNFGESGRFERLAQLYNDDDVRDTGTSTWKVIDAIEEINATALNTYRILSHSTYDTLPHLVDDIGENVPRKIASICKHIDAEFWIAAKNVSEISVNFLWK